MRTIMLSVSGLALTACSMAGGGYADQNKVTTHCCGASNYAATSYNHSTPAMPTYGHATSGQYSYGQTSHRPSGYPVTLNHSYDTGQPSVVSYPVAQTPSPHAYGTHAGHHAKRTHHGLRGASVSQRPHFYGSLGAIMYDVDDSAFGVQSRAGYQFHPILGAELEGSVGVIDSNESFTYEDPNNPGTFYTEDAEVGVDYSVGAFATARMPLTPRISAVGRAGYHMTTTKASFETGGLDVSITEDFDGLAYGAGLEYQVSATDAIRADYTRYEGDGLGLDSVAVGYLRRF